MSQKRQKKKGIQHFAIGPVIAISVSLNGIFDPQTKQSL
jgi:hypothetical protein